MRCLCVFAFLFSPALFGQTDRGTISGTVSDPARAVVANAPIEVKNTQTGAVYPAATSETGNFTLPQLPPGNYELTVTVPGFKKHVRQNILVEATQTVPVDVALEIGIVTDAVTVEAKTTLLRSASGDISVNVSGDRLVNLGTLGIGNGFASAHGVRNPLAVVNLAPGTYFEPNANLRVNGAPSNTEAVRVDGQDSTAGVSSFAQAHTQPSVEAIQEFSVQTSNYAAEYGQAGSGVINYTTRSGGNQFHGLLFDYNSNEAYNASQAYSHLRPKQRRDDFGGALGGPIRIPKVYDGHDKSFFFFAFEEFREVAVIASISPTVPIQAYRDGNFAAALSGRPITGSPQDLNGLTAIDGQIFDPATQSIASNGARIRLPFVNNAIPLTSFDSSAKKILAFVPRPTSPNTLVNNFNSPFITDRRTPIPALKLDHSLSAKAKVSYYWSTNRTAVQYCTPACNSEGFPDEITGTAGTFIESSTQRLNFDYTLAPTVLLHLGAGYLHLSLKGRSPITNFDMAKTFGITGQTLAPDRGAIPPNFFAMLGANSQGGLSLSSNPNGSAMGTLANFRNEEIKPTFNASLVWVKGNHTYKFGGEGRTDGYPSASIGAVSGSFTTGADQTANPWFTDSGKAINGGALGFPFASFLLGRVTSVTLAQPTFLRGGRKVLGFFAQDTWKATRKLTLSYGLRWDYFTYAREQHGRSPDFSPTAINSNAGGHPGGSIFEGDGPGHCGCDFAHNYPLAFGPRLGIAYQINPKTVFRAGAGVVYSSTIGSIQSTGGGSRTVNAPSFGEPAMILSGGITNQGQPLIPVWPDIRADLFPLLGTVGPAPPLVDNNSGRPARQLQWSAGLQREISRDVVVEATYIGNRGVWWRTATLSPYNTLTPELLKSYGLDISNPADRTILAAQIGQSGAMQFRNRLPYTGFPTTQTVAQSLRPFPQFQAPGMPQAPSITAQGPLGKTWYDSLQAKVTKRFAHGLDASYFFAWSKELQLGAENDQGFGMVNDIYNRDTNKQLSSFSRPFANFFALRYTVPIWGPSNKWFRFAFSDWNVGAGMQLYVSGAPIAVPSTAAQTTNLAASLLRATRAERIPGVPLFLQDLNCHCFDPAQTQVLNPAAWRDPGTTYDATGKAIAYNGSFSPSAAYYNDYRQQRRANKSMSFGRTFQIKERVSLMIRAEFANVFNQTSIPNPIPGIVSPTSSTVYTMAISTTTAPNGLKVNSGGFGVIPTLPSPAVGGERSGLLVGRLQF